LRFTACRAGNVFWSIWRSWQPHTGLFRHHSDPIYPREKLLDDPLSTLFGLRTASQREKLPQWLLPLLEDVKNGSLEVQTRQALEMTG
jgi:hypothetical protein